MKSPCLIRNADVYSIPGGWSLKHPALDRTIEGRSPEDAIASVLGMLRVNNIAATPAQLWEWANEVWGRRVIAGGQMERWMGPPLDMSNPAGLPAEAPMLRRILTPKDTGPVLWGTLHLIPLVWDKAGWMGMIGLMTALIEPGGFEPGCKLCASHWQAFRAANPPELVNDARTAAEWSWRAHNGASGHAGNRQWTWREAATKWGWPAEWEPGKV